MNVYAYSHSSILSHSLNIKKYIHSIDSRNSVAEKDDKKKPIKSSSMAGATDDDSKTSRQLKEEESCN